jgi:hypothetical protein
MVEMVARWTNTYFRMEKGNPMHLGRMSNQSGAIALLSLAWIMGCAGPSGNPAANRAPNPSVVAFHRRLTAEGSVSFRSNNGKAYRMDGDTELTFYPDGKICMLEWGLSPQEFWGNYRICPEGWLICWFQDYRSEWPAVGLAIEGSDLLLRPLNPPNGLTPMRPGDATQPADLQYWRFRTLTGDDAREVLRTIERWRDRAAP